MEMIDIIEPVQFKLGLTAAQAEQLREAYSLSPFPFFREMPAHTVTVRPFRIAETPVTSSEFLQFVEAGGYEKTDLWSALLDEPELDGSKLLGSFTDRSGRPGPMSWTDGKPPAGAGDHPVSGVSWFEAQAYCRFRGLRLPAEAEWELAVRGTDGRLYPWGNEFDPERTGHASRPERGTMSVRSMNKGRSAYGLLHAVGNVAQWCEDRYASYPGGGAERDVGPLDRVVRGDFYVGVPESLRTTVRAPQAPETRFPGLGFRCASDPE